MLPAKVLVPLTDKLVTPLTAPLKIAAPEMVKALVPPVIPLVVTDEPVKVRLPLRVTTSPYNCVPLVVISPAKVLVPPTDRFELLIELVIDPLESIFRVDPRAIVPAY